MKFRDAYNQLKAMKPPTPEQKKKLIKAMMTPPGIGSAIAKSIRGTKGQTPYSKGGGNGRMM